MADVVCAQNFFRRKVTKPILQVTVCERRPEKHVIWKDELWTLGYVRTSDMGVEPRFSKKDGCAIAGIITAR